MIELIIHYFGFGLCMIGGIGYTKSIVHKGESKINMFDLFVSSRGTLMKVSLIVWGLGGAIMMLSAQAS